MTEKCKKYINFLLQFTLFFSENGINYPLFSVFKRINISSKKPYLFLVQNKEMYAITRKKFLFTEKVDFSMIFCLFHCFHKKNKQKTMNIATIYLFLKNFINDVFFNVFRSINGILHKTPFYKCNIGNLNKE